ncbi:Pr6Pr family membrane protein [Labrys wisconsinensis]|uniref:Pr6Pr family membrane protein n=1 Tax=Labrys wisconsinensis TaxID=425677 RepID=A0ABU0JFP8_9HYPH|nr:Pr6Pr family membrane protein [Labrys wisconsinensis]MDQ0473110.1 hypothetical protein [Labrys wisconsinensis]
MASIARLERPLLILIAVLVWPAALYQVFLATGMTMAAGHSLLDGLVTAFSFFTILTNLLVGVVTVALIRRGQGGTFLTRPGTLAAVAVYILVVGVIYALLLSGLHVFTGLALVADSVVHRAVPVLYALYWLLFARKGALRWADPLAWLIYPLLYIVHTLVRGALTGRYPYPFADAARLGYPTALANGAAILAFFLGLGLVLVALDRAMGRIAAGAGSRRAP